MKLQDGLIFFYQSLHSLLDNLLILSGLRLKESYEFYKNRMMLILCWVTQSLTTNFFVFCFLRNLFKISYLNNVRLSYDLVFTRLILLKRYFSSLDFCNPLP